MHFHIRPDADSDAECPSGTIGSESKKVDSPFVQLTDQITRSLNRRVGETENFRGSIQMNRLVSVRGRGGKHFGCQFDTSNFGGPESLELCSCQSGRANWQARNDDERMETLTTQTMSREEDDGEKFREFFFYLLVERKVAERGPGRGKLLAKGN